VLDVDVMLEGLARARRRHGYAALPSAVARERLYASAFLVPGVRWFVSHSETDAGDTPDAAAISVTVTRAASRRCRAVPSASAARVSAIRRGPAWSRDQGSGRGCRGET